MCIERYAFPTLSSCSNSFKTWIKCHWVKLPNSNLLKSDFLYSLQKKLETYKDKEVWGLENLIRKRERKPKRCGSSPLNRAPLIRDLCQAAYVCAPHRPFGVLDKSGASLHTGYNHHIERLLKKLKMTPQIIACW